MISFALTEEQTLVQAAARQFAADEARPAARASDEAGEFPETLASPGLGTWTGEERSGRRTDGSTGGPERGCAR